MKLTKEDIQKIKHKTKGGCFWCGNTFGKLDFHHIIFKNATQGGSDHSDNLLLACSAMTGCKAHWHIHSGLESQKYIKKTKDYLPENLDNCWKGRIKSKIIQEIENDRVAKLF